MRSHARLLAIAVVAMIWAIGPGSHASLATAEKGVRIHEELPKDPLAVLAFWVEDLQKVSRGLLPMLDTPEQKGMAQPFSPLREIVRWLVRSGEGDLSAIGPEFALVLDFPAIDEAALAYATSENLDGVLSRVGLLARIDDLEKTDKALRELVVRMGGDSVERDGIVRVRLPLDTLEAPLVFFYGLREERLAVGFSEEWVGATLPGLPEGSRLIDGVDFARIRPRLESRPSSLTYINLPKLQKLVTESQLVAMVLAQDPGARQFIDRFIRSEALDVGLGSTSIVDGDAVRTSSYGPVWLSGPTVAGGLVASLVVPAWLQSAERGKTRRTLADIESIATACEGFSTDAHGYPATPGWVPVGSIASHLEPIYIPLIPREDAWEHPILYWSDGASYRIISTGKDGRMDQDWSSMIEPTASVALEGDIVYGDGRFLVLPRQVTAE